MSKMLSIGDKIKQLHTMTGHHSELSHWEQGFVTGICERTKLGENTTSLSDGQIEKLDQVWEKHFGHEHFR